MSEAIHKLLDEAEIKTTTTPLNSKISLVLKPVGTAEKFVSGEGGALEFALKGDNTFAMLMQRLRKKFGESIKNNESFIFYIGNISICPNVTIKDVYNNFNTGGKLIISYAKTAAWG